MNLDKPVLLVIYEVVDRGASVYKPAYLFGRRILEFATIARRVDLALKQIPRRVLFAVRAAVAVDVQHFVPLGVVLPSLDRSVSVSPLNEPPQQVMLLLLGAPPGLPACFGQLALAENHTGMGACAPSVRD